jgi:CRISPR/Cas system-associated exonuclease Cas4 (RecB family)
MSGEIRKKRWTELQAELQPVLKLSKRSCKRLLNKEKDRRRVKHSQLVFLSMANVAQYWWCAAGALIKSRSQEWKFFLAYLLDRLRYSLELDKIKKLPRRQLDWLDIGEELTLKDLQPLLEHKASQLKYSFVVFTAEVRNGVMYINPALSPEEAEIYRDDARKRGLQVASAQEDALLRGQMLETSKAEKYPTIRWSFPWGGYIVVGVPDGITDSFVYEYKTTRSKFLLAFTKPVALAQADLYGYFFERKSKRIQIYIQRDGKTYTTDEPVDRRRALRTLKKFQSIDAGAPAQPPKAWKCKNCEYRKDCQARPTGGQA